MSRTFGKVIGAALLLAAIGCGGGGATPEATFKEFQAAVKARDGDKAWNLLSNESQTQMEKQVKALKAMLSGQLELLGKLPGDAKKQLEAKMAEKFGMTMDEFKAIDARGMFKLSLKQADATKGGLDDLNSATLENVKVEGDKATATVKTSKKSEPIQFVKEGGSWKITMPMK